MTAAVFDPEKALLAYLREQDLVVLRSMIAQACEPETCTQLENQLARHLDSHIRAVKLLQRYCQSARNVLLNHARQNPIDRTCRLEAEALAEVLP